MGLARLDPGTQAADPDPISGLLFAGSGSLPQEFDRIDLQDIGKLADDLQADIGRAFLQLADVAPVDIRLMCQILLGNAFGIPETAEVGSEGLAQVHCDNGRPCRLLTNGFKTT